VDNTARAAALLKMLHMAYHEDFYARAYCILSSHGIRDSGLAESAVQEAYVTALSRADKFLDSPNPKGWIKTAILNHCRNFLRDNAHVRRRVARIMESCDPGDFQTSMLYQELLLELESILTKDELWLFLKYAIEGYTSAELAPLLNTSRSNVGKRYSTIIQKLSKIYRSPKIDAVSTDCS